MQTRLPGEANEAGEEERSIRKFMDVALCKGLWERSQGGQAPGPRSLSWKLTSQVFYRMEKRAASENVSPAAWRWR